MPLNVLDASQLLRNKMIGLGYEVAIRSFPTGDFGALAEVDAMCGEWNAIVNFWSMGFGGNGMIDYLLMRKFHSSDGQCHIEMPLESVWVEVDRDIDNLIDQVLQHLRSVQSAHTISS